VKKLNPIFGEKATFIVLRSTWGKDGCGSFETTALALSVAGVSATV
jgi:hypothetical protein